MGDMAIHFSRNSDEWATPEDFYMFMRGHYGYDLDAAASRDNSKCGGDYLGLDHANPLKRDALAVSWGSVAYPLRVWVNPPYSLCRQFVAKAAEEATAGRVTAVDLLLPARTDTRYWHDVVMPHATYVRLVKGRLKFGGAANGAPFPSCVVTFHPGVRPCSRPVFLQILRTEAGGWESR